jgi:hypothetical protein
LPLCAKRAMEVCGQGSLLPLASQPCQRQGTPCIDHRHQQRHTPASHHAALAEEPQGPHGEVREQERGLGEEVDLCVDRGGVAPAGKALDAACRLGAIGNWRRNVGQLRALAGDKATDEGSQGGQVPGALPWGLTRIALCQGSPYGTILAEGVTRGKATNDRHTSQGQ